MSYNTTLIDTEIVLAAGKENFEAVALQVFHYQYTNNPLYRAYCDALRTDISKVRSVRQIPFLPVSFFKTHTVITHAAKKYDATQVRAAGQATEREGAHWVWHNLGNAATVFESSGTTGETPSRHYVYDTGLYERALLKGFEEFYGPAKQYAVLALLPSYLERKNASLVHMAQTLMNESGHADNGFYIDEWDKLTGVLNRLEGEKQKVLLLGVTFALLDFAAMHPMHLENTIVMETGGMKGRREELTREEVHLKLKEGLGVHDVHSEYGMTELLSQAYAKANGIFTCTGTMRVFLRDINDPLDVTEAGTGAINIIDLANVNSCSFIATEDMGRLAADGTFEVLGRMDHTALRGCSLMAV